jgi:hypothetical protein
MGRLKLGVWLGALLDTGCVTATDYLWLEQELVNNSKDDSQTQLVNVHKLHLVNEITHSQVVFDSLYPYNCIQHNGDGSLKNY